jgi:hypothetical protein
MGGMYSFLAGVLASFLGWFLKRVTIRGAAVVAYIAAYVALLLTLFLTAKTLVAGLVYVSNDVLKMAFFIFWPDNAEVVFSAVVGTDLSIAIWRIHRENMKAIMKSLMLS